MQPSSQRATVALAAYSVLVAGVAVTYCWRESRAHVAWATDNAANAAADTATTPLPLPQRHTSAFDPHATHALWTLYQPLLPPLLFWWLWCRAVHRYARRGVPYARCYPRAERSALPTAGAVAAAAARASALAATAFALSVALLALGGGGGKVIDAVALYAVPMAMYNAFLAWLLWPSPPRPLASSALAAATPTPTEDLTPRLLLRRSLTRALLPGLLAPVGWADFFLADCLTSLSKSALDLERAACATLGAGPLKSRPAHLGASRGACGASSPPALAALCLPFFLRLCQCVSVALRREDGGGGGGGGWIGGGGRTSGGGGGKGGDEKQQQQPPLRSLQSQRRRNQQLANAGKYALGMLAAALTQLEHEHHVHGEPFALRRLWIAVSLASAAFSFCWDAEMDWGLAWVADWWRSRRRAGTMAARAAAGRRPGSAAGLTAAAATMPPLLPPLLPKLPRPQAPPPHRPHAHHHQSAQLHFPLLLATNALLRMTWAHRLVGDLEAHALVQMSVALLEVLRRHRWAHGRHALELARRREERRRARRRRRRRSGGKGAALEGGPNSEEVSGSSGSSDGGGENEDGGNDGADSGDGGDHDDNDPEA
jgi:hypothetical protein